jgi:GNAT superfamily N-acetyltransferase
MTSNRIFPDEPAGPFEPPPRTFEDREGREIALREYEGEQEIREALVEMYLDFDPADRAQGIPPGQESRIRDWLDNIMGEDCLNVVAWDGESAVGHATLVPDGEAHELAIFVLQSYQGAGIGSRLIEALLGLGSVRGATKIWLTVERWNRPAVGLYKKLGFEVCDSESFEMEMSLRLEPLDEGDDAGESDEPEDADQADEADDE